MKQKSNSRITNTIYNFSTSMGGQFLTILMHFVIRTVFIQTLGKSYLGINGLFSNILSMLSLTELGFGTAILYKLYEPIAINDFHRIKVLMNFYKKAYYVIGIVIAGIGLCLIPFLPVLIEDYDHLAELGINAVFIFLLYLLKSVSSYLFFAYKNAIIKANQKEYLINIVSYVFTVGAGLLQILCLILFRDFIIYVLISVLQVIFQNIATAVLSDRLFPFLKEATNDKLDIAEVKSIFKDCFALFIYDVNKVVLKSTDNIVISAFLGLEMVGLYSNYYILYTTIYTLFSKIYDSLTHSLGNLHTEKTMDKEYNVFEAVNLITAIIGGTAAVGIFCVADELIHAWIGAEWVIPQPFALLMGLELYTLAYCKAFNRYRTIMGLFQQAKYRPLAGIIINLGVSIVLVNVCGIVGVLIGTVTSDWLTFVWFDPLIIHKHGFKQQYSLMRYFRKFAGSLLIVVIVGFLDYMICHNFLVGHGWASVIIHSLICGITVPAALVIVFRNSDEGYYLANLVKRYLRKFRIIH